jgi:hypothetical protein
MLRAQPGPFSRFLRALAENLSLQRGENLRYSAERKSVVHASRGIIGGGNGCKAAIL